MNNNDNSLNNNNNRNININININNNSINSRNNNSNNSIDNNNNNSSNNISNINNNITNNDELLKWINKKRKKSNDNMHINNFYKYNPPNFKILSNKYPSFDRFIINKTEKIYNVNWKDPEAVRELTRVLLDHDFGLKIELPMDHLCPTITLRVNYLYWIQEKINDLNIINNNIVNGIDIGTGASCIFPLLGARLFSNWRFLALDIDDNSLSYAKKNIQLNSLDSKISLFKNEDKDQILLSYFLNYKKENQEEEEQPQFDFCLCNPPFFKDLSETNINPKSTCIASSNELVTEGGELSFVKRIISDSFILKSKIKLYSSMIGRKCNLKPLLDILKNQYSLPSSNIFTTELSQGSTSRWVIAWIVENNNNNSDSDCNSLKKLKTNNNNNNNNNFLNRVERRKFYREGLIIEFNNNKDNNINNNNKDSQIINKFKSALKENSIKIINNSNEETIKCQSLLNNLIDLEKEVEFSFIAQIKYGNYNEVKSVLMKPIEPENENKQIINSNLYYIKSLFNLLIKAISQ